jgi:hypothetical protein
MNIHYKIVELWPDDHLVVARFWTDSISEMDLASGPDLKADGTPVRCRTDVSISLPVPMPTDPEELDKIIKVAGPIVWLKTLEDVKNPNVDTSLDHVVNMLNVPRTTTIDEITGIMKTIAYPDRPADPSPQEEHKDLSDDEIQKLIDAVNAKTN